QLRDPRDVGPATDTWSLALVVYECLVGHSPFQGRSVSEILADLDHAKLPLPSEKLGGTTALDEWFARATHSDPSQRRSSPSELARELHAALLGETEPSSTHVGHALHLPAPPDPTPPNPTLPSLPLTRKRLTWVAAVVLFVGAAFAWSFPKEAPPSVVDSSL